MLTARDCSGRAASTRSGASTPNARQLFRATARSTSCSHARSAPTSAFRHPLGHVERCLKSDGSEATKRVRFDRQWALRAPTGAPRGKKKLDLQVFESRRSQHAELDVGWSVAGAPRVGQGSTRGLRTLPFGVFGRHRGRADFSEPCGFARPGATRGDTRSTLVMKGSPVRVRASASIYERVCAHRRTRWRRR